MIAITSIYSAPEAAGLTRMFGVFPNCRVIGYPSMLRPRLL